MSRIPLIDPAATTAHRQALLEQSVVDERGRDERAQPEDGDDAEGEPDLPAEVGRPEDPADSAEQEASWGNVEADGGLTTPVRPT